jgi:hypothetical protein
VHRPVLDALELIKPVTGRPLTPTQYQRRGEQVPVDGVDPRRPERTVYEYTTAFTSASMWLCANRAAPACEASALAWAGVASSANRYAGATHPSGTSTLVNVPRELMRDRQVRVRVSMMPTVETLTAPPAVVDPDVRVRGDRADITLPLAAEATYRVDVLARKATQQSLTGAVQSPTTRPDEEPAARQFIARSRGLYG